MKKKIISSLVLSLMLVLNVVLIKNTFAAIASGQPCGTASGCPVAATSETVTDVCDSGLVCSLAPTATAAYDAAAPCTCQKAFGSGLSSVRNTAGLSNTSVPQIVGSVIKVILGVSGTVALIFVVWGGIQWMISKGDEKKITDARKLMTSGMIGIAIIAAAYAITDFVIKQITVVAGA